MAKFNHWLNPFSTKPSTQTLGRQTEALALKHLQNQGLQLIARNWSCRGGELDLVMLDSDTVVFIEVRYRSSERYGGAIESIDLRKRSRITLAAQRYLQSETRWQAYPCRFDVVTLKPGNLTPSVQWLKNAFDASHYS